MIETKRQLAEQAEGRWEVGRDGVFVCEHGVRVEDDGRCPNGCESPMLQAGMI